MLLGSSVSPKGLNDKAYLDLLTENFDVFYSDCGFDWQEKGSVCNNDKAAAVNLFGTYEGKELRGNSLCSATRRIVNRKVSLQEVGYHLETTMGMFPEIKYWDAVHETLDDNGNLRRCAWGESLGKEEWQEIVLRTAKESNPDAVLFYCDYFRTPEKWESAYNMVSGWLEKGVPIDGISIQLHSNLKPSLDNQYSTLNIIEAGFWMRQFRRLGLSVHVPEVVVWQPASTINLKSLVGKSNLFKEILRKGYGDFLLQVADVEAMQAKVYFDIMRECVESGVDLIGFWSAFDKYPWNWVGNRSKGGLWDENYCRKKAYYAVLDGVEHSVCMAKLFSEMAWERETQVSL